MATTWASRLFGSAARKVVRRVFSEDGVLIVVEGELADSEAIDATSMIGYLAQLNDEGRLSEVAIGTLLLPWHEVYEILETAEGKEELAALALPPIQPLYPRLVSEGVLASENFTVGVNGWRAGESTDLDDVTCMGAIAYVNDAKVLLPRGSYRVMTKLREFFATNPRTPDFNRSFWGSLRNEAVQAGAVLDEFLYSTIVLTPEKLTIELQRSNPGGVNVVEVEPWFAGAPANWIEHFDSLSKVHNLYSIPTPQGIVQVVITPKVRAVLQAIKAMPGRRVAGDLGERFVTNPMATLGGAAEGIIDPAQFEQAREEAGFTFKRFMAKVILNEANETIQVGLEIRELANDTAWLQYERFADAEDLRRFITRADLRYSTGNELFSWRGHDLQLLGDTPRELETLKLAFDDWTRHRVSIRFAEISDLAKYSPRVEGIGIQKPLVSPYLPRPDGSPFGEDRDDVSGIDAKTVVVNLPVKDGKEITVLLTPADVAEVEARIKSAKKSGSDAITWPDTDTRVDLLEAESTVESVRNAWRDPAPDPGAPPAVTDGAPKPKRGARQELLLRANVESAQYRETRAEILKPDPSRRPVLPASLLPDVKLKDHQLVGIAWLQNLIEQGPDYCRGAILADDMGLGKTLQLLAFIAALFEKNSSIGPVLVVAPVSLLENWKAEAMRFFKPNAFAMLTLYGDELAGLRAPLASIDEELVGHGLVRFLKPDWLANHKVVLTTYETMRDLEFSLAAVHWSVMICDEAQKIKNPGAMVTRSAMKQNVDFKIACTGTPVENSLVDLWCLLDYVQPGLLGALNEFGSRYRRPIECEGDPEAQARLIELREIIEPQILRRMKSHVAKDLQPKHIVQEAQSLQMSQFQKTLYVNALEAYRNRQSAQNGARFKTVLELISFLRRVCTDPKEPGQGTFVPIELGEYRKRSPKLDWLLDTLKDIKARGEKVIVFCEFREMQRMLVHYIEEVHKFRPDVINGDTSTSAKPEFSRQKRIDAFQSKPGFGVIILSPVAVGFGVNIQAANHVIHFSRTWNPAKEDQATDRAYRIGQTKPVYVYYPVVRAKDFKTFDVKLHELLEQKRALAGDMLNGTGNVLPNEFDDVVGIGAATFEERIDIDAAICLEPDFFEALTAFLWAKKGFKTVLLTPASNDDGVDVVAKTQKKGELVQCKSSSNQGVELDWNAVKDVVTGHAAYRLRYPSTEFKLVCITNQFFNTKARHMADLNGVELIDQAGLKGLLEQHKVVMSDLEKLLATR